MAAVLPLGALAIVGFMVLAVVVADSNRGPEIEPVEVPAQEDDTARTAPRATPASNVCQGTLNRPDPNGPRTFDPEYTQIVETNGITIVANSNVDPRAVDEAKKTVQRVFENNDLEDVLSAEGAYVIVADREQGVLDLPEFRCLDSSRNQDFFSHVCGVADRADYPVVTVNELDLLGNRRGPCAGLNILYHELGHMVQGWALPPADYFDVRQFYQDALFAGKYKGEYASTNANEYFAEATQSYFLYGEPDGSKDREWLEEYDPQIFDVLERTFGD